MQEIIRVLRNVGITIGGITFLIFMIKIGVDPDSKGRYIKLARNTVIASILITLSLTLLEIPKDYFGSPVGVADEGISEVTFSKIEDKDCQSREVVNIDGKRFVVTDVNKKLVSVSDNETLTEAAGINVGGKFIENVSYLRPFNECQGFFKGFYSKIEYFRDADGYIFPSSFTYNEYLSYKSEARSEEVVLVQDKIMLNIPSQIRLKVELFDGYGVEELIKTLIVLGVSSIIAYIIYLCTRIVLMSTMLVIGSVVIAVVFLTKNRNNFSMADNMMNIIKYELMQKRYKYERDNFKIEKTNKNVK